MSEETEIRQDAWLTERVSLLRENHFADVPQGYPIVTRFGTRARYRFGSIAARNGQTIILINRLFADAYVPTFVVDGTLAHELAHYAHGFGSGLPRLYQHAHRGGVVDKELEKRGLGELSLKAEQWRKIHWETFYNVQCGDLSTTRLARVETTDELWNHLLCRPENRTEAELLGRLVLLAARLGQPTSLSALFGVEWLQATTRQAGLSYWFRKARVVRVHGLLADRRVPTVVIDFELAYWLARLAVGNNWQTILATLRAAGLESTADEALRWRQRSWTAFARRHHPLAPK